MKRICSRVATIILTLGLFLILFSSGAMADDLSMVAVSSVELGGAHSAAITQDGVLYCWGSNYQGELGGGSGFYETEPIKIKENVASVSLGKWHSGLLTEDGTLYTVGANHLGQLGNGTKQDSKTWEQIEKNVTAISFGAVLLQKLPMMVLHIPGEGIIWDVIITMDHFMPPIQKKP